jgi:hypothetical protein
VPSNPYKTKKKTITKADGTKTEVTIYWFRVEAGHDAGGKRKQIYKSFEKLKDAKAEYVSRKFAEWDASAQTVNELTHANGSTE